MLNEVFNIPLYTDYLHGEISFDVILLSLNWYRPKDPRTPLGMAYIAAYCNKYLHFRKGHTLQLLEVDVRDNLSTTIHSILVYHPAILGIGVYCWNADATAKILSSLRGLGYTGIIVLGGPEISYGNQQLPVEYPEADYFVRGDGEQAFAFIVQALADQHKPMFPGIFSRLDTTFDTVATLQSLDLVPPPHTLPQLLPRIIGDGFTRWQTQRGCVFKCTFCAFSNPHSPSRETSITKIAEELQNFVNLHVTEVAVLDPVFFVNRKRSMDILLLIEAIAPKIRFEVQTRLEHLTDELIAKIGQLHMVLECGIQTLDLKVQKSIKRTNNIHKVIENMHKLSNNNIPFETHLIFGLPEQTLESFLQDLDILLTNKCSIIRLFPLALLKGTMLDAQLAEEYKNQLEFSPIFPREIIRTQWMSQETIYVLKHMQKTIDEYFNKDFKTHTKSSQKLFNETKQQLFRI